MYTDIFYVILLFYVSMVDTLKGWYTSLVNDTAYVTYDIGYDSNI